MAESPSQTHGAYQQLVHLVIERIWSEFQLARYREHVPPADWPPAMRELEDHGRLRIARRTNEAFQSLLLALRADGLVQQGAATGFRLNRYEDLFNFGIDKVFMLHQTLAQTTLAQTPDATLEQLQAAVFRQAEDRGAFPPGYDFNKAILSGYIAQTEQELALLGGAHTLSGFLNDCLHQASGYQEMQQQQDEAAARQRASHELIEGLVERLPLDAAGKQVWQQKVIGPIMAIAAHTHSLESERRSISSADRRALAKSQETIRVLKRNIAGRVRDPEAAAELQGALDTCLEFAQTMQREADKPPAETAPALDPHAAAALADSLLCDIVEEMKRTLPPESLETFAVSWDAEQSQAGTDLVRIGKAFDRLQFYDFCAHITTERLLERKVADSKKYGDLQLVLTPGRGRPVYARRLHDQARREVILLPTRIDGEGVELYQALAQALFDYHGARAADQVQLDSLLTDLADKGIHLALPKRKSSQASPSPRQLLPHYFAQFVYQATTGRPPAQVVPQTYQAFCRWATDRLPADLIVPTSLRSAFYNIAFAGEAKRLAKLRELKGPRRFAAECLLPVLYTRQAERLLAGEGGYTGEDPLWETLQACFACLRCLPDAYLAVRRDGGTRDLFSEASNAYERLAQDPERRAEPRAYSAVVNALAQLMRAPNARTGNAFAQHYKDLAEKDLTFEIERCQRVLRDTLPPAENLDLLGLVYLHHGENQAARAALLAYTAELERDRDRQQKRRQSISTSALRREAPPEAAPAAAPGQPTAPRVTHDDFAYFNLALACMRLGAWDEAHQNLTTFHTLASREEHAFFARLAARVNELVVAGEHDEALSLAARDKARAWEKPPSS